MKKDTHPKNYRKVVFRDISNDVEFVTHSCADTSETVDFEGATYPLIKMEISAASHPFFTGKMQFVDTAGRIDKFNKRFSKFAEANPTAQEAEEGSEENAAE
jgi:large subunit ribosomal protein L31